LWGSGWHQQGCHHMASEEAVEGQLLYNKPWGALAEWVWL
jgi:hypothetical protein